MCKQKIAFIVAVPDSAHSFLKEHFIELVKEYDVNLIANFPNKEIIKEFTDLGVTCHQVSIMREINLMNDINALFALIRLFYKLKFVSVHSVTPKAGLLTSVAGWMTSVPHRIHIYTGQVWATRKGLMRSLLKLMDRLIALFDTNILVDGQSQRNFLIQEGVISKESSRVLAHGSICGVKLDRFLRSEEVRKAERTKYGFADNDVVYIFMGRLNHDKGVGELFQAFNKLVRECSNAKMILYGADEGDYEVQMSQYSNIMRNNNLFYPGETHEPYNAMQVGDVFVLPTWREGFGCSVIEAQALGLPVITSDAYGVLDASIPNETGLRCGVNDPIGLYECMKIYYEQPELRILHGNAGERRVESLFDNQVVTAAWVEYYREILSI